MRPHRPLVRVPSDPAERAAHLPAARDAWAKIDRLGLIEKLEAEFGGPDSRREAIEAPILRFKVK